MKKFINIAILSIIISFAVALTDYFGIFKTDKSIVVDIPNGSGIIQISKILKDNKIIRNEKIFSVYSIVKDARYHAGKHTFTTKNYRKIYKELSNSTNSNTKIITITEGMEQREIAVLLENNGICSEFEFNKTAKIVNFNEYWFLKDLPKREYELEGYLFPDTYEFSIGDSAKNVISKMLDNFNNKISDDIKQRTSNIGLSFDEVINLASIVEREAANDMDFKLVAGVFFNRLNYKGEGDGYLRSCATVQYILQERKNVLSIADTKIDSPYNSYINEGLPIGPISSPGLKTIEAVLSPAKTDYVYFASDANGKIYYAKTYAEHQSNMRKAGL